MSGDISCLIQDAKGQYTLFFNSPPPPYTSEMHGKMHTYGIKNKTKTIQNQPTTTNITNTKLVLSVQSADDIREY